MEWVSRGVIKGCLHSQAKFYNSMCNFMTQISKVLKRILPHTTFFKAVLFWEVIDMVWYTIRKDSVFLCSDPVCVPYCFSENIQLLLYKWYHDESQKHSASKIYINTIILNQVKFMDILRPIYMVQLLSTIIAYN